MSREGRVILAVALLLMGLGLVILYSASAITSAERHKDEFWFLKKQAMWAGLGTIALLVCSRIPHKRWIDFAPWLALLSLALLIAVLVPGIGRTVNGARRWIGAGPVNIQASELARLATIFLVVRLMCRAPELRAGFLKGFVPPFGLAVATAGLIAVEPDIGGAAFTMAVLTAIMLAGGISLAHLVPTCVAAGGVLATFALTRLEYIWRRVREGWWNPEADPLGVSYQLQQSLIALGAGGLTGAGLGQGFQKLRFLPEPHSDFILAILGEELGLLGTLGVLGLFAILAIAGCRVALRAPDREGRLLAFGLAFMITLQASINIGVVTGCLPTKGIPLPFMSYGGSSLLCLSAATGILIGIANRISEPIDASISA
jgi:cell division protein FtsW